MKFDLLDQEYGNVFCPISNGRIITSKKDLLPIAPYTSMNIALNLNSPKKYLPLTSQV